MSSHPLWFSSSCGLNVCAPLPKLYIETLIPNTMVSEGWALVRWLGYEGGAPVNRISALIRQDIEEMIALSTMWGYNTSAICSPEDSPPQIQTILPSWMHNL